MQKGAKKLYDLEGTEQDKRGGGGREMKSAVYYAAGRFVFYYLYYYFLFAPTLEHRASVKRFVTFQFLNLGHSVELLG
jgi:hypothetical protein